MYSSEQLLIRPAVKEDTDKMLEIYTPYIFKTPITFEYEVPSSKIFQQRIMKIEEKYPVLVILRDNCLLAMPTSANSGPVPLIHGWLKHPSTFLKMPEDWGWDMPFMTAWNPLHRPWESGSFMPLSRFQIPKAKSSTKAAATSCAVSFQTAASKMDNGTVWDIIGKLFMNYPFILSP